MEYFINFLLVILWPICFSVGELLLAFFVNFISFVNYISVFTNIFKTNKEI